MAFLYGWKCLLVMDPGLSAALATGFAEYVAYLVPLTETGLKVLAVAAIACLALVTALGTRLAASALVAITAAKLAILAAIIGFGLVETGGPAALAPAWRREDSWSSRPTTRRLFPTSARASTAKTFGSCPSPKPVPA